MTKNINNKTFQTFKEPSSGGRYESSNPDGDVIIRLLGSDFGGEPTIDFFAKWTGGLVGQVVGLDSQDIGSDFTSGHYTNGIKSNYFALDGTTGASIRQGGTDAATDNQRTGFVRVVNNYDTYFLQYDVGTDAAAGRTFSGETVPYAKSAASTAKLAWPSDQPLDDPLLADIVAMSWTGPAGFAVDGNQSAPAIYMGTRYDFDVFNAISVYQEPGARPKIDNGITEAVITSPSQKTLVKVVTDQPTFSSSATNAYYNHVNFPGWTGNGSQDLTQHLFRYAYHAVGANARSRIELTDAPVYEDSGKRRVIPHQTWLTTQIESYPVDTKQRSGVTNIHFTYSDGTREMHDLADAVITEERGNTVWTFGSTS